jgi:hypothetical protein
MLNRHSGAHAMTRSLILPAAALVVVVAACSSDTSTTPQANQSTQLSPAVAAMLSDGFATSTAGFSQTDNSYLASGDMSEGFMPEGWGLSQGLFDRTHDFMGGGLGVDFDGDGAFFDTDHGDFDGGPFVPRNSKDCTFSAATGRFTCPPQTFGGLTINRSFAYTDVNGKAQSARDTTTNSVNTQSTVTGTIVNHDKKDTTSVNSSSTRTVTGLVKSATKRTVDGKSGSTETTVGLTRDTVKFKTTRMQGDTTVGLTLPITNGRTTFPNAGTVTRSMQVLVQVTGKPDAKSNRREVITYDTSDTAKIVITHDTTTKNCKLPLPRGHLTCS